MESDRLSATGLPKAPLPGPAAEEGAGEAVTAPIGRDLGSGGSLYLRSARRGIEGSDNLRVGRISAELAGLDLAKPPIVGEPLARTLQIILTPSSVLRVHIFNRHLGDVVEGHVVEVVVEGVVGGIVEAMVVLDDDMIAPAEEVEGI